MRIFENQVVLKGMCDVERQPPERLNSIHVIQNEIIQDAEFINCEFIGAGLATYGQPVNRSTMRNIHLKDCRCNGFSGTGVVFDDIVIDGLRASNPIILFGCVFRHVVVSGACGQFLINRKRFSIHNPVLDAAFEAANIEFYKDVDWALDITNLKTSGFEIRGSIPARLIRRNPEEHFIMARSAAETGDWKEHDPYSSFEIGVSTFLNSGAEDTVLVAERRSKKFKEQLAFYQRLKEAGIVT